MISAVGWLGCGDPGGEDQAEALCEWSGPHRLFPADPAPGHVSSFGRAGELPFLPDADPDALYFSAGDAVYLSGPCGDDLRTLSADLPDDGLRHVHPDLAFDCARNTVHRRDPGGALAAAYEGVGCDAYFVTLEGFFAELPADEIGSVRLIRLLDLDAPELPVAPLHDAPLSRVLGPFVGPRDVVTVDKARARHLTGHWGSPFVALTTDHRVLRLDPRGGAPSELVNNVAALWPSPDGEAFAFQIRMADGTGGDVYVYAGGEHRLLVADAELPPSPRPWWSADGRWFAMSFGEFHARDRVLELPSGQAWWTSPGSYVQRELPGGGLWLSTLDEDTVREEYWDPEAGVRRELWEHPTLPWGSVRAARDGLEMLIPGDRRSGTWWWGEGELIVAPYDGSRPLRPSKRVSPMYTRLPDGRIVTPRATPPDGTWPEVADLILIDPSDGSEQLIDTGAASGRWSPWQLEASAAFHRVLGDLVIYNIVDDARSGVWAVSLSRL